MAKGPEGIKKAPPFGGALFSGDLGESHPQVEYEKLNTSFK